MDKVSLEGKEYVKAASVARELGYTRDYIGQLCRAKKIDAQLVGRSWYVYLPSLHEHKKNRYQNAEHNKPKTQSTVSVGTEKLQTEVIEESSEKNFEVQTEVFKSTTRHQDAAQEKPAPNQDSSFKEKLEEANTVVVERRPVNYERHLQNYRPLKYVVDDAELFPGVKQLSVTSEGETLSRENGKKNIDTSVDVPVREAPEEASDYYIETASSQFPQSGTLQVADVDVVQFVAEEQKRRKAKVTSKDHSANQQSQTKPASQARAKKIQANIKNTATNTVAAKQRVADEPHIDPVLKTLVGPMSEEAFAKAEKQTKISTVSSSGGTSTQLPSTLSTQVRSALLSPITLSIVAGALFCSLALGLSWRLDFTNGDVAAEGGLNMANGINTQQ